MTVYVCYFEYGGWDSCSHPVAVFHKKEDALDWVEMMQSSNAKIREMVMAKEYNPR